MTARYRRQVSLIGTTNQNKLIDARVTVLGAGGLGSPALLYLAGAGIGSVTIIDDDVVDQSNLHRQIIHREDSIGTPKVESAAAQMRALNPTVNVNVISERLTWDNAVPLLEGTDVVLDGTDNFDTRHVASFAAARLGIPHVWGSILGHEAQMSVFWAGHGPVYEDLFPSPPGAGVVPNCAQAGVLGPVVGVVGAAMALEALKLVTGMGSPLVGTLAFFDSLSGRWEYVPLTPSPAVRERLLNEDPPQQDSLAVPEVDEIPEGAALIDVRSPEEFSAFAIDGAVNIPLPEILAGHQSPAGPAVVYCAGGVRSAQAVSALAERGITGLVSLRGGIDRWLEDRL